MGICEYQGSKINLPCYFWLSFKQTSEFGKNLPASDVIKTALGWQISGHSE